METPSCVQKTFLPSLLVINLLAIVHSHVLTSISLATYNTNFGIETDRLALLAFKNHIGDGQGGALSSWNKSVHVCTWKGVTCGRRHRRVTVLNLTDEGITATLPPSIGNLTFLRKIDLSYNQFRGAIPKELSRLRRLVLLDMVSNLLTGDILELTNLSSISYIYLDQNNLTGNIPSRLGSWSNNLQYLSLAKNNLLGSIPSSFGNLSSIQALSFAGNNIEGTIPSEIGQLRDLFFLSFGVNNLSGTIPPSLYNLSSLQVLSLSENHLSGSLPTSLGHNLPNLQILYLGGNQFTGSIPPTISNISTLQQLGININNFTGEVPGDMGRLKEMQIIAIGVNSLGWGYSGDLNFISSLTNISNLRDLGLEDNLFGGVLPTSITNLSTQLTQLLLGSNKLYGHIPKEIGNLKSLTLLSLENNYVTGVIPTSVGMLQNLEEVYLSGNGITGFIPSSVGNLTALYHLTMVSNYLEGNIPSSFRNCKNLQLLYLSENKLSGKIPGEAFGNLVFLHLDQNSLSGSLPREIGNFKNIREIQVAHNKLSGGIPKELGGCVVLEELNMSHNSFEGNIPDSFSSLKGLKLIDLSHNHLSGDIPHEIQNLSSLHRLDLSFNMLGGEVPTDGVFKNQSEILLNGNKNLCGGIQELKLPPCSGLRSSKDGKTIPRKAKIVVTITSVFILALAVGSTYLIFKRKITTENKSSNSLVTEGYLRLSYKQLLDAAEGFASSNLIGKGSFGSVYKGILAEDNKHIAIKVLNLENSGAMKSFKAECLTLAKARHRNILKILTACSSINFKGDDFLALVYEFMPNGNLDDWLHKSRNLSLCQRVDMAIDVVLALIYLHQHCQPQIIHCDLKPSNILFDNEMVAHVGDFGLARLVTSLSELNTYPSTSSAFKGSIGYVAPEYGIGGKPFPQGDTFSYGIILLEMVTGKRPTDDMFIDGLSLHTYAKMALSPRIREIVDAYLLKEVEEFASSSILGQNASVILWDSLTSIAEMGIACSSETSVDRMSLDDVLKELQVIKRKLSSLHQISQAQPIGETSSIP